MNFPQDQIDRLCRKLTKLATSFPNIEAEDLDRLNDLVGHAQVAACIERELLGRLDVSGVYSLQLMGEMCLESSASNLAEVLVRYCLDKGIVTDVEQQGGLVDVIVDVICRFELSAYVDVEQQSNRVRVAHKATGFTLNVDRLLSTKRLRLLRLLRDAYVERLLDKTLYQVPDLQALQILKYNNVTRLIRTTDRSQLEETRWSRLYALEDLEYGTRASSDLFRDELLTPPLFDELLLKHFNIMLLPALGNIGFGPRRISANNEGHGCIQDPILEIWSEHELVASVSVTDTVPAHRSCIFHLQPDSLGALNALDPNGQLQFRLCFRKFDGTPFVFVRDMRVAEVVDSTVPDEQHPGSRNISTERDLFDRVVEFMKNIRHIVEQDDGHALLTNDSTHGTRIPRDETEIQLQLKRWLRPMCRSANVDLTREASTGRGALDFKFSVGHALKCIVEVKLGHSSKVKHGIDIQLPTYMTAENTTFGVYVPIYFDRARYDSTIDSLRESVVKLAEERKFAIEVIDIRAWKPDSASKAVSLDDAGRYT